MIMSDCRQCGKVLEQVEGKRERLYCDDKCKKRYQRAHNGTGDNGTEPYRDNDNGTTPAIVDSEGIVQQWHPITDASSLPRVMQPRTASYQDYLDNPDDYATRASAELLNWGPRLGFVEFVKSEYIANRVPIPGDWDYVGVAKTYVNGQGQEYTVNESVEL